MARPSRRRPYPDTSSVDVRGLAADLRARLEGEVRFDRGSRGLYATDASNYRQVPLGVVIPRSVDDVVAAVAVCHQYGAPLLSRGGGTSLAGQGCNAGVIIDFSKHLHHVLEIDPVRKTARVQPGVILDHLRSRTERDHLTYGPDPATHNRCTFGGMVGNNSCGIHSVMAGRTADNVHELEIVTYDGVRMRVGATSEGELERLVAAGGRPGKIHLDLLALRDRYAQLIRERYPRIPRRVSGYNLDDLLPENGFHVARALVGTESTCVTVLEATVALVHSPPHRVLVVLGYPDVYHAGEHVPQVMEHRPVGLEGLDHFLVKFMKLKDFHTRDIPYLPDGQGWLLVEFGGDSQQEAVDRAKEAMEALKRAGHAPTMKLYTDKEEMADVWEVRESGLGATANVPTLPLAWPGWEDSAVPPDKVGAYLRDFRGLLERYEYVASLYGHFGQGCIHTRISFDLQTADGIRKYLAFIDEASDMVAGYGGSFSGEHGDGQSRAALLPKMYGKELVEAFGEFKRIWDPDGKMNPGKVVDPYGIDQNLRLGAGYTPWQPKTHFKFPQDNGSFARATLRCVGVGKCRRTADAFMCPSFLVTREENDTTRGRAHLLFEMFHGGLITDGWRSREVRDSLDLCLGCKGCLRDCPVDVDLGTYKSEFLSHHYARRLRPRDAYAMGLIEYWAQLGSLAPGLANLVPRLPAVGSLVKLAAGISPHRSLPAFGDQRFTDWFRKRDRRNRGSGRRVVLYPDVFNDHFHPETLQAGARVLERLGFQVELPPRQVGAVRPLLHYGMLDLAERKLKQIVGRLHPALEQGLPIVFLEPSTAAVFRHELSELFPNDEDGQRLTKASRLLSEFVVDEDLEVPRLEGKAVFHGHCHQKAVLRVEAARTVLQRMGLEIEEPQPGCCGMAGSFGMEARHYDISIAIGELGLLPAVRKAGRETWIVADGFSCRSQIAEGAGRKALHLAELMLEGFLRADGGSVA